MSRSGFILGVDLDGVCGDYTAALRQVVIERTGASPESLPLDAGWDFKEWGLSGAQFDDMHQAAVMEHRIFRTMPVMTGASDSRHNVSAAPVITGIVRKMRCSITAA